MAVEGNCNTEKRTEWPVTPCTILFMHTVLTGLTDNARPPLQRPPE